MKCLGLDAKIGQNISGSKNKSWRVQFSDASLYAWLMKIGLMPNKSKIIGKIDVPDTYFFDFLRGCFDGDGSVYSYFDPRWKSSFMFYVSFVSASKTHIFWLQSEIERLIKVSGHITKSRTSSVYQLKYAKKNQRQ